MMALQKRASLVSKGGSDSEQNNDALRAYKAAQARLAMPADKRERARKRWKDAGETLSIKMKKYSSANN